MKSKAVIEAENKLKEAKKTCISSVIDEASRNLDKIYDMEFEQIEMKTIVSLTRVFKKEVTIEISKDLLKGMDEDQIQTFLMEEYEHEDEDKLFENAELVQIDFDEDSLNEADTDRFDIEDGNGNNIFGGHL
jgi:hypothetical protein